MSFFDDCDIISYEEESEEDIFDRADEAYDRKRMEDHEKQEALLYERDWEIYREKLNKQKHENINANLFTDL